MSMNNLDVLLRCTIKNPDTGKPEQVICFVDDNDVGYILNVTMPHADRMTHYDRIRDITRLLNDAISVEYFNEQYITKHGEQYYVNVFM